ncbi:unnamed protein product [Coffea canephora]|uniref:Uncharacterized protein n=1 Tax=Coffea canephora TaxID=49390 RepID=A0A068V6C6_COFCA|nr:unnamed protein product [Coffea canephora]
MPSSSQLTTLLKKIRLSSSPSKLPIKNPLGVEVRVRPFSSLPSSTTQKRWSYFSEDDSETETSPVYNHALKFQRPSTIIYGGYSQPANSVSLIGTIQLPLKRIQKFDRFGVYTMLNVQACPKSKNTFRIMLKMWDEMAEMSMHHVKPNDFVYIWGNLGSYMKADKNGNPRMFYKVTAKELNYVAQQREKTVHQQVEKVDVQGEDYEERLRNRLHLWQVFFANPYEWKDFRNSKAKPNHPDFKNMSTDEALWLRASDPPWIKKQLEFVDSASAGLNLGGHMSSTSFRSLLANDTGDGTGEPTGGEEIKYVA